MIASITQKLEDLGWAEDLAGICMPDSLANHKLVDRPQLLTERSNFFFGSSLMRAYVF